MSFTFITNLNNIKNEYYLKQPKTMLQWRLIEKLARNSKPTNAFDRNVDTLENQDQNMELMM